LEKREWQHRHVSGNSSGSRNIPSECEWVMKLLEECNADNRYMKEQYWFDTLKPLYNERRPGRTAKEWWAVNRDYMNAKSRADYRRKCGTVRSYTRVN
jgi:hypothetical protein